MGRDLNGLKRKSFLLSVIAGVTIAIFIVTSGAFTEVPYPPEGCRAQVVDLEDFWVRAADGRPAWALTTQSVSRLIVKWEGSVPTVELWAVHAANDDGVDLQIRYSGSNRILWQARLRSPREGPSQMAILPSLDGKYVALCYSMGGGISAGHLDFCEIEVTPDETREVRDYMLWDPWNLAGILTLTGTKGIAPKLGSTNVPAYRLQHLAPDALRFRIQRPQSVPNWFLSQRGDDWIITARVKCQGKKVWHVCMSSPVGNPGQPFRLKSKTRERPDDPRVLCQINLGRIKSAKEEWTKRYRKQVGDKCDILGVDEYIPESPPHCRANGIYEYGLIGENPQCTVHGIIDDAYWP